MSIMYQTLIRSTIATSRDGAEHADKGMYKQSI